MRGADLLVSCLENEGVEYIFGVPGEETLDLTDALADSRIKFVLARHEGGASFMADVYGRLTARPGVCLATLGPGATNLLTGVADAYMDSAPLVAITGQASMDRIHKESHQVIDTVSIYRPVTKWSSLVQQAEVIPEMVRKAFKLAAMEKFGATHLDFPEDIAAQEVAGEPLPVESPVLPEATKASLACAAALIDAAKNPLVLAGAGVVRAKAWSALRDFAERLNIPVAHTFMAKGAIPDDHPLSLMAVGLQSNDYVLCGFNRADLIIAVGYDMVEYHPRLWNPNRDKRIIHIAMTTAEVDTSYLPQMEVQGDIGYSLNFLANHAKPKADAPIAEALRAPLADMLAEHENDKGFPLKPQKIIYDLRAALASDDLLISDVGAHKLWIARLYPCFRPNTCVISNGLAAMGISLPGALAGKLIFPEKTVVAATGDGGFMMNSQELETAVRLRLPVVVLVFNDQAYGVIKWKQINRFGRATFVDFGNPDFVKYAESFGAQGYKVKAADELRPILAEAIKAQVPCVIDCPVDYSENLKLTEQLGALVCPI